MAKETSHGNGVFMNNLSITDDLPDVERINQVQASIGNIKRPKSKAVPAPASRQHTPCRPAGGFAEMVKAALANSRPARAAVIILPGSQKV
jgi:hypothetical protein